MSGDWFDAASTVLSFCKYSSQDPDKIERFQQLFVRLMSLLNAMILAELEGHNVGDDVRNEDLKDSVLGARAMTFELLHPDAIDAQYLERIKKAKHKAELVFQWIQNLIVENIVNGVLSIPPPLLTRTFQDLGSGMLHYHDALKYADTPFPFPYTCATEILLMLHWIVTPIYACTLTNSKVWVACFSVMLVFVLWCLHLIAGELENPFGDDKNDLNMLEMQVDMNESLASLISTEAQETPKLCIPTREARTSLVANLTRREVSRKCFHQIFSTQGSRLSLGKVRVSLQNHFRNSQAEDKSSQDDRSSSFEKFSVNSQESSGSGLLQWIEHTHKGSSDELCRTTVPVGRGSYSYDLDSSNATDTSQDFAYSSEKRSQMDSKQLYNDKSDLGGCGSASRWSETWMLEDVAEEDVPFQTLPETLWRLNIGVSDPRPRNDMIPIP